MPHITLENYASTIQLSEHYTPVLPSHVTKEEIITKLLQTLEKEHGQHINNYSNKRQLLKGLLTVREARPLPKKFINKLDTLLQLELVEKSIVQTHDLTPVSELVPQCNFSESDQLSLWQGDITRLGADAIVNAANKYMLGCFQPYHACIDNAIHSAAGPQLREDCSIIMSMQQELETTGSAKITRGYNLPARYVLHTVGPKVQSGLTLTDNQREELADCYRSCLELANEIQNIKTMAFCAISTGVYGFPKSEAANIAVRTVNAWMSTHTHHFERIIFNVFSADDYNEYLQVFNSKESDVDSNDH